MKVSPEFRKQLEGYGLTTAEILYRMPDHPSLLQSYVWQDYDLFPEFPTLRKFLSILSELGGHNGRQHDSPPGPQTIWIGIRRMHDFAIAWETFGPLSRKRELVGK